MSRDAARQVAARQVAARQVAARQVAARQVAARQVAARQVAARQVAARQVAARPVDGADVGQALDRSAADGLLFSCDRVALLRGQRLCAGSTRGARPLALRVPSWDGLLDRHS